MRILIIIIFLLSPFVAQASTLKEMLALKSSNYVVLKTFYTRLKGLLQKEKEFCAYAASQRPLLEQIFYDDRALIGELRNTSNPDYREYATHLEDNSYSPLFSLESFRNLCEGQQSEIRKLDQSLQYHVMNIDYLLNVNELFIGSVH